MTAFATSQRVANTWRPLTSAEEVVADELLAQASRRIRHRFPTIDARIAAGDIDPDLVGDVAVAMVKRVMQNPDGLQMEQIEDSVTRWDSSTRRLELIDDEIDLLTPPETARTGQAFQVPFGNVPPTGTDVSRQYLGRGRRHR